MKLSTSDWKFIQSESLKLPRHCSWVKLDFCVGFLQISIWPNPAYAEKLYRLQTSRVSLPDYSTLSSLMSDFFSSVTFSINNELKAFLECFIPPPLNIALHLQISSRCLLLLKPPPREKLRHMRWSTEPELSLIR